MLHVSKPSTNRLNIELSGALDAEAMGSALHNLIEKSEGITNGKMLYRISDFEMPTLSAMAVELQQMPRLFSLINKFEKCAVLSDTAWIRTAAEIEGAMFPSLAIKSFAMKDIKAAEAWLDDQTHEESDRDDDENFPV
ncbi:SpoIIAA-like [Roseovarius tolerans]|uniref:SpoIIAA-like n=1 Tax=Roseovarius tolerans TaxID=74031 RepID=A0A1H7WQS7_9RHOB|nr:STAS/SEC14 domain-containing protein [Roseovarius tolerans]SEM23793.1 SpoIIAA-like [Roseovarius tolerans]